MNIIHVDFRPLFKETIAKDLELHGPEPVSKYLYAQGLHPSAILGYVRRWMKSRGARV